ncbi:MinD/ParA family ATP-binding protein [Sphaerisporangium perillae]|uniref:MinD/ParA family ATP-binding protein n=1 Tax=Sphaerisporangium perillae TaxID=2935860 RepID=UPI00200DD5BF|nr:MinD/ParA family protein [Sphaerisporangium perillae]
MARHDREDPHSLEEQLAWLDAIKENEEAPVAVTVTADETVVSPYPKDPWAMVPTESPAPASPLFRAAGDPAHGAAQAGDGGEERAEGDTREVRPAGVERLDTWAKPGEGISSSPAGGRGRAAFAAPITGPSEPLSRSDTRSDGRSDTRSDGRTESRPDAASPGSGAFGERSVSSGGAFGERPAASGTGAFGERPAASGSGAFGESPAGAGSGAFGERSAASGAFGERSAASGAFAAFSDRPASSGGALGERPAASSASAPPAKETVGDDTDSFTFGSLAEPPPGGGNSGWPTLDPLGTGKAEPSKPSKPRKEPEPEPDTSGDQPVRGWLEAAIPAAETAEAGETDPEQERFNAFALGADTDDVVVPRTEHALYEQLTEKVPLPAPLASRQAAHPVSEPSSPAPPPARDFPLASSATEFPRGPQATEFSTGAQAPQAPAAASHAPAAPPSAASGGEPATREEPPEEREPYRPRRRQTSPPAQSLQPAFGAPARQQASGKAGGGKAASGKAASGGVRQTADSLDPVSLLRGRRNAPAGGWRKVVYKASAGLIKPGESPEVRRRRELVSRARTPVATGHHRVAVLSLKGGVGKTTTTVGLGATLASVRGDRVIAVDANPDRGTLSDKLELETSATVRDLLNERQQIKRYVDIRAFTSQAPSRLEILASDRDPSVSEAFSAADYQAVAQVLENFYSICLTDCGTGLLHSAMSGVLGLADQLVLVSSPSVDGARAASATLDWLEAHHYADLVKDATVVLCSVRPRSKSTVDLDRLEAHFAARCRAVIRVPYDPHLEEGAEIDLDRLQPATRESYLLLAASVGDGFGGAHL